MFKVIICDLKSSRTMKNRYEVQRVLIDIIKSCNIKFHDWIVSNFRITAGDEWEGILDINAPTKEILDYFKNNLPHGIYFYAGIGTGTLSIEDFSLPVNLLDGEAFVKARENLNSNKKYKNIYF